VEPNYYPDWFERFTVERDKFRQLLAQSPIYDPLGDRKSALQLIDIMGTDLSVVNDARSSFDKISIELSAKDEKLIDYLAHQQPPHSSPFRGCALKFRVSAPLPICRQWLKHIVASNHSDEQHQWNEMSFRFTELTEPKFYTPEKYRTQSTSNRQSSGDYLDEETNQRVRQLAIENQNRAFETYQTMLTLGVSREQARDALPTGTYTTWTWTVSLQSLLHFIELRKGSGAQTEILAYAQVLTEIVTKLFPATCAAWFREVESELPS